MDASFEQRKKTPQAPVATMQLVGFGIGKERFGVDILTVREIIRDVSITAIPNTPGFVEGVINLRGNIIPIIDLRKRLILPLGENDPDQVWILILEIEGRTIGFRVDVVTKVVKIQENAIEPPPEIVVAGLESQFIHGVCDIDGHLVILLDFSHILKVDEINRLKEMAE